TGNVVSAVEHTFALLFALLRRVSEASVSLASGKWEKSKFLGSELAGKTLGIVGLGQVGSRVAARARAFEARLLGHDPYLPLEKAHEMGVPLVSLEELLQSSDIVTLHATATEGGRPLIGRDELARMKPGAVLAVPLVPGRGAAALARGRDVGSARGPPAAGRGRVGQGRSSDPHPGNRELRQRVLRRARPGPVSRRDEA